MLGKLYLIPVPLGENANHTIPPYVIDILHNLRVFIVERAKSARHFIKNTQPNIAISDFIFYELNEHTPTTDIVSFLEKAEIGENIGLLSEAGCPAIADPGAQIVALAHKKGIEVVPLVGPSSILLALMASGMNGQSFCFQGYLSAKTPDLIKDLRRLEQTSAKWNQTQIFIETPYRNQNLIEQALKSLLPQTRFCIAADLTLPTQYIITKNIQQWQKTTIPTFHKRLALFLLQA